MYGILTWLPAAGPRSGKGMLRHALQPEYLQAGERVGVDLHDVNHTIQLGYAIFLALGHVPPMHVTHGSLNVSGLAAAIALQFSEPLDNRSSTFVADNHHTGVISVSQRFDDHAARFQMREFLVRSNRVLR